MARSREIMNYGNGLAFLFYFDIHFITHFFLRILCLTCRHSRQCALILLSWYYIVRGGTIMNYAKKLSFLSLRTFFELRKEKKWWIRGLFPHPFLIRRFHRMHALWAFVFRQPVETKGLIPIIFRFVSYGKFPSVM